MRRTLICIPLLLVLLFSLALPGFAAETLPLVIDGAGLLSDNEQELLESRARDLQREYNLDVVIVTALSLDGKTPQAYADDFFDYNGYGDGSDGQGILFLVSVEERDWYISTYGDTIYAVTDYGVQVLGETALPHLASGAYYDAFSAYLTALPDFFDTYSDGAPLDGYADTSGDYYHGDREYTVHYEVKRTPNLFFSVFIGVLAAVITVAVMYSSMNTKRPQHSAAGYIRPGSFHLRVHQDLFLYSNVSKIRRAESSSGGGSHGGGGSSVHHSSSGRSHGGGGGKF